MSKRVTRKCRPLALALLLAAPAAAVWAGSPAEILQANGTVAPGWAFFSGREVLPDGGGANALAGWENFAEMQPARQRGIWVALPKPGEAREQVAAQWRVENGRLAALPGMAAPSGGKPGAGQPVLAVYTVPEGQAGFYAIKDGMMHCAKGRAGARLELRVFVRHAGAEDAGQPAPVVWAGLDAGESFDFDTFLGYLDVGDTVCVGVGPSGDAAGDRAEMNFQVARLPALPVSVFPGGAGQGLPASPWALRNNVPEGSPLNWDEPSDKTFALEGASAKVPLAAGGQEAVAAFRVPQSGYYALNDAWAAVSGEAGTVKARILVGKESAARRSLVLPETAGQKASLNTDLGYLEKGTPIFLTFAPGGEDRKAAAVEFGASVVEWAPRRAPLRVQRGSDGYLDVYEPEAPLKAVDIPEDRWVNVPAQEGDATQAIRKAFEDARAMQKDGNYAGVRLEAGKSYTVGSRQIGGAVFEFENFQRVIFDGQGATLVINSPEFARKIVDLFSLKDSSRMAFADFTSADTSLPYTVGEVLEVNPPNSNTQTVTFRVEQGYPDPLADISRNGSSSGYAYDPKIPGRLAQGSWSHYPDAGKPGIRATDTPGEFTHQVTRTGNSIVPGSKWLIKNKVAGVNYLATRGSSEDVTLWKLNARASGGGLLRFWGTSGINILDCQFVPIDNRWISSTADGVHGRGREGVWIENTAIRGICEDVMNTYGETMAVEADGKPDDNVFSIRMFTRANDAPGGRALRMPGKNTIRLGDQLLFFNPQSGQVLGLAAVTAVADGRYTLSETIPGVDSWEEKDGKGATMVYNTSSVGRFFVRDSSIEDSMRFGIYIKAQGGVMFHNHFEGLSGPAILAANEPEWPEGPPATHLWVQGNTFNQNNFGYMSRHRSFMVVDPAEISVYTRSLRKSSAPNDYRAFLAQGQFANSHVKIVGNTFHDWRGMGIAVRNSRNVLIADNVFLPPVDDPVLRETLSQEPKLARNGKGGYAAIFLDSVNGVRITGNQFYALPEGDQPIVIGEGVKDIVESRNVSSNAVPENLNVSLPSSEQRKFPAVAEGGGAARQ